MLPGHQAQRRDGGRLDGRTGERQRMVIAPDPQARHELETALMKSEKLGLRALGAKIHYLLGTTLRLTGNETEAARQYGEALRLLGEIRKEKGTDKLMERSDLSAIFAESSHWSQGKPE